MLIADTAFDASPAALTSLVQSIGVLGVLICIIWTGFKGIWTFKWVWTRFLETAQMRTEAERQRAERAEAEVARLRLAYEDKVMPALESSNQLQREAYSYLSSSRDKIEELIREIAELKGSRRA